MKNKSESVKVAVRVRPMNNREKEEHSTICVEVDPSNNTISINSPKHETKTFQFDYVYPMESTQKEVYNQVAFPIVDSIFSGYNGTIFAYGQTGCGKTFTMMGIPNDPNLRGVIPNAFEHIFSYIKNEETSKKFLLRCSFVEIYNEEVRDLLVSNKKIDNNKALEIRDDPKKGTIIKDLTYITLKNSSDIQIALDKGNKNRHVGATSMNDQSSRSHSLFTVYLEIQEGSEKNKKIRSGKLNLVDLAGSERVGKTNATGKTFDEGKKINLSLTALGSVIDALSSNRKHIPYKDSKLTRLLSDSLGGNTKTVMFANVSPASFNYDETVGTLRYASRAKLIKNAPKINEDPKDALLRKYEEEIKNLKSLLEGNSNNNHNLNNNVIVKKVNSNMDPNEKELLLKKIAELEKNLIDSDKIINENLNEGEDDNDNKIKQNELKRKEIEEEKIKFKKFRENQLKKCEEMEKKFLELEKEKKEQEKKLQNNVDELNKQIKLLSDELEELKINNINDRRDFMENIKDSIKNNLLFREIIKHLLTENEFKKIIDVSRYFEDEEKWKIHPFEIKEKKLNLPNILNYNIQTFIENNISKRDFIIDDKYFNKEDYINIKPLRESKKNFFDNYNNIDLNKKSHKKYDIKLKIKSVPKSNNINIGNFYKEYEELMKQEKNKIEKQNESTSPYIKKSSNEKLKIDLNSNKNFILPPNIHKKKSKNYLDSNNNNDKIIKKDSIKKNNNNNELLISSNSNNSNNNNRKKSPVVDLIESFDVSESLENKTLAKKNSKENIDLYSKNFATKLSKLLSNSEIQKNDSNNNLNSNQEYNNINNNLKIKLNNNNNNNNNIHSSLNLNIIQSNKYKFNHLPALNLPNKSNNHNSNKNINNIINNNNKLEEYKINTDNKNIGRKFLSPGRIKLAPIVAKKKQ